MIIRPINQANAHGGGTLQLANVPLGECLLSVWSSPPTLRAGSALHITVGLAQTADSQPFLEGVVQVVVYEANGRTPIHNVPATTEQSTNKLFYEADVDALPAGDYRVEVTTTCLETTETVGFNLQVRPSINPLFVVIPLASTALLAGFFIFRNWRKRETAVTPVKKRSQPH
ncbi:MAG: hypothetical protein GY796_18890 [Chloroflexi bacterium]|nr:hypothetical protein [Chloroflexota bacterium]